jgi:hypothetical protein
VVQIGYESNTGQFQERPGPHPAKPSGDHIPLGSFVLASLSQTNCHLIPDGLAGGGCLPDASQRKETYMRCKMDGRRRCMF